MGCVTHGEAEVTNRLGLLAITLPLDRITSDATRLPLDMTWSRAAAVLVFTIGMCAIAGFMALRQVRSADPAEVFV